MNLDGIIFGVARKVAFDKGFEYVWTPDWDLGGCNHAQFYGDEAYPLGEPETCERVVLVDMDGHILAALGCIDDADDFYRKTIQVDLLMEALSQPVPA